MKKFMDKDFLLSTETAKTLYHEAAAGMPIFDDHCHISPKEIYENRRFKNMTEVWLSGDHYKWRVMRSCGVSEYYITGAASDKEKFFKFAECLPLAIGNPMYHWCHLELKNYFGYEGTLSSETAEEVWQLCERKLAEPDMSVRGLIEKSNVAFIGTTDDPIDNLEWHKKIKEEGVMSATVAPSFRPDKALNIDKAGFAEYIAKLSEVSGVEIGTVADVKAALSKRVDFFNAMGAKASDHGLDYIIYREADEDEINAILKKGLDGKLVSIEEAEKYKTALLVFCAEEYHRVGWVMQLHYNCMRNNNARMFEKLGPDTGFDSIGPSNSAPALSKLLSYLDAQGKLPKTVLYSLDPSDDAFIGTIIGAFQGEGVRGKIQHGSAWWFNDNKTGMIAQMTSLANLGILGNFIGMLTDSRSFLSYTRHEYFRRILCNLIGTWVENGEYPADIPALKAMVENICYGNAVKYFDM
jgi:glucuronate isomerase